MQAHLMYNYNVCLNFDTGTDYNLLPFLRKKSSAPQIRFSSVIQSNFLKD